MGDSPGSRLLLSRDTISQEETLKLQYEHHQKYLNDLHINYSVNQTPHEKYSNIRSPSPANYNEDSNIMIEQNYSLSKL
jgi:hypothetical protein